MKMKIVIGWIMIKRFQLIIVNGIISCHNMLPKDSKEKDERNKTEEVSECNLFDSFSFEAKDAKTAILLLQSKEKSVLLTTVKALSQYANKSKDNIKILFDLDIVKNILPIIEHEDIFTRRFAAKLLVEIMTVSDVTIYLIESNYLPHFVKLLTTEEDIFMQEYLSAILVKLSKDPCGAALLVEHCSNMDFLFEKIQSPDPDIQKNNIEILYNLMQDLAGAYKILKSQQFNFSLLFQHFESTYPEIQQHALIIVATIIDMNKVEDIQSLFLKANGIQILLNFLKNDEWSDLHIEALRILSRAVENPSIAHEFINSEGISQILSYIENEASSELFTETFKVIAHISNTSDGRKILHLHGVVGYLLDILEQSTQSDIVEIICHAIGKMTFYNPAAEKFAKEKSIEIILGVLKKEDLQWSARHSACYALKQLLTSNIRNCEVFLDLHGQDYLLKLVEQSEKQVPVEICITILEALIVVARHSSLRNSLINFNIVDAICLFLESSYPCVDEFKIACCNLLSVLCLEKDGRRYILEANGPERLYALITDAYSIPIRNSAVQLIQTISTDPLVADAFIKSKYLRHMLNNRSSARVIPSWNTCIETLFKSHLPAKFAFTGRLSLQDVTQDGFYVLRKSLCPFPALDEIFRLKCSPIEPIYVVNFSTPSVDPQNEISFEGDINSQLELKYGRLQYDSYLVEYVKLFKCMLSAVESKNDMTALGIGLTNIQYISSRSQMLAQFVARQMSGFDPENKCIPYQLEFHLKEIKDHLGTNVIPLGQLRVGSYLERALLFKVIADRICLPAALVRGGYGISWIEIAIPRVEDSNEERSEVPFGAYLYENAEYRSKLITSTSSKSSDKVDSRSCDDKYKTEKAFLPRDDRSTIYPIKHMIPNFIVDLMDTPGDLIPIGSPRSKLYCTAKLPCDDKCCQ